MCSGWRPLGSAQTARVDLRESMWLGTSIGCSYAHCTSMHVTKRRRRFQIQEGEAKWGTLGGAIKALEGGMRLLTPGSVPYGAAWSGCMH